MGSGNSKSDKKGNKNVNNKKAKEVGGKAVAKPGASSEIKKETQQPKPDVELKVVAEIVNNAESMPIEEQDQSAAMPGTSGASNLPAAEINNDTVEQKMDEVIVNSSENSPTDENKQTVEKEMAESANQKPTSSVAEVENVPSVDSLIIGKDVTDNAAAKVAATKMPVILYQFDPSPPCRAVKMLAKAIGLELDIKIIDITKGDNKTPEYVKMNPCSSIPTINDNGFVIWESRAIMPYLVDAYAKDDSLYPKDTQARAIVDHRLYFDIGTLYQTYLQYWIPFVLRGVPLDPEKQKAFENAMGYFNTIIEGHKFAAGDHLTIADISIIPAISNIEAFEYDLSQYPNILKWYQRTKEALMPYGYNEINQPMAELFGQFYKSKLG